MPIYKWTLITWPLREFLTKNINPDVAVLENRLLNKKMPFLWSDKKMVIFRVATVIIAYLIWSKEKQSIMQRSASKNCNSCDH